ncbi:MAG: hypothetical protein Q4A00_07910 [Flavobacteriaceae bacterium]|nr:hypothetical protein [Flavobacteriaceae bacterium]
MKKALFLLGFGMISNVLFSQSNVELKKEIDDIKISLMNLHTEIQSVKNENLYYKKTLDINKPITQTIVNNLEFTIISAIGNKNNKTLEINYLHKNISDEVRKRYQVMGGYIVDDRGNQTNTYNVFATKNNVAIENIQPNIPIKGFIKFKIDEIDFPIIKVLNLGFSYEGKDVYAKHEQIAVFKDIPVKWE